jgi:hypothetical protein
MQRMNHPIMKLLIELCEGHTMAVIVFASTDLQLGTLGTTSSAATMLACQDDLYEAAFLTSLFFHA